jgi:hypothetical protein
MPSCWVRWGLSNFLPGLSLILPSSRNYTVWEVLKTPVHVCVLCQPLQQIHTGHSSERDTHAVEPEA